MNSINKVPSSLTIIAGKGVYPRLLADSARSQGVEHINVLAFRGETGSGIQRLADQVQWVTVGRLAEFKQALRQLGDTDAVMVGQITPTALFRARPDRPMLELVSKLERRNAHTLFGAIGEVISAEGITLHPASMFMESAMPAPGQLSRRAPDERESNDIALGLEVAKVTSSIEAGQTVVVKEGTILAVEAFEGTDRTIRRAGRLGGPGAVVVKVAKRDHDMRFDIPVIGMKTMRVLRRARISALALEARRTILLEKDRVLGQADQIGLAVIAVQTEDSGAPQQTEQS